MGVSSAAAFGASIAIVLLGVTSLGGELTIVLCAFGCAVGCAVLVYLVCAAAGMSPESVVLAGTAMSYLFSAGSSALQFFADEHQLSDVVQWTFGSLNGISWREVGIMALFVAPCSLALRRFALAFNAMAAGEDGVVRGLGVNPAAVRVTAGLLSILMTAAIISFTGVIGFVGLIGPHIARFVVGGDHRFLLPFSGAVGGPAADGGGHGGQGHSGPGDHPGGHCGLLFGGAPLPQSDPDREKEVFAMSLQVEELASATAAGSRYWTG